MCCWFKKARLLMQGCSIKVAFVATNSITQGEQVPVLWKEILIDGCRISFAYRTFKWENEAKGKAAVHCVIVGLHTGDESHQCLLIDEEGKRRGVPCINAYLLAAADVFIESRSKPICDVTPIVYGNKPTDGGHLFFSSEEMEDFLQGSPEARGLFRRVYGAKEFINGTYRYCLWLHDISPSVYKMYAEIMDRIRRVHDFRLASSKQMTRDSAQTPMLFQEIRHNDKEYIIIPRHSSENRKYIPIGFVSKDCIATDAVQIIPDATLYHFGVLTSTMHMAWARTVCGRLKSDYRYSNKLVYNNFPWPETTVAQQEKIAELAQGVLDARALYPECSLADLYDPLTMPPELVSAHRKLDAAVEKAYGRTFADDAERVAFLFEKYRELTEK